jgi:hypothetical protein
MMTDSILFKIHLVYGNVSYGVHLPAMQLHSVISSSAVVQARLAIAMEQEWEQEWEWE